MGKGRKSQYIRKLTSKDQAFLMALRDVGYLSPSHIKKSIGLTDKRITNFERDDLIERCAYWDKQSKEMYHIYRLTDKGKRLCETQLNMTNFYKSSSARHDLALADKYFSLLQSDRDSWGTEGDARDILTEHINRVHTREPARADELRERWLEKRELSPTDAFYVRDGRIIAIEIITDSYGAAELQAKEEFIRELDFSYEPIRI